MPSGRMTFSGSRCFKTGTVSIRSYCRVKTRLVLVMPQADRSWREGIKLANAFRRLPDEKIRYITEPIREGFAANFRSEGSAAGGWRHLAARTVYEREELLHSEGFAGAGRGSLVPGFTPTHPILQRTGDYMRSWTQAGHPSHGRDKSDFGQASVSIMEGSEDYRAEDLSLGTGGGEEGGRLPPRPVHFLSGLYEVSIGAKLEAALTQYVQTVHP